MFFNRQNSLESLPIDDLLPDIVERLRGAPALVLQAAPGAGKSTRVPPALVNEGLAGEGQLIMLVPRQVAARATARRIASEWGVILGQEVGYRVRFDDCTCERTKIVIMTEGILAGWLQRDPLLEGVNVVILDEFHERSIHSELALAFLSELQQVRDDLKVVVMSATIDTQPLAQYLKAPVIESEGRNYPVAIKYLEQPINGSIETVINRIIRRVLSDPGDDSGNILVFLPGAGEIHRCMDMLQEWVDCDAIEIWPLYSSLNPAQQDRALERSAKRKIILSTNIAETSVTIDGVTVVVDSGQVKQLVQAPDTGLDTLQLKHISMASANQRAGRAGRLSPGRAYRLWTRAYEMRMDDYDMPEIQRIDLTSAILEVIAWSGGSPHEFNWFERPPNHATEKAIEQLRLIGAISPTDFRLTEIGKRLRQFAAHPRLARILLEATERGVLEQVADICACLSERDFILNTPRDALITDSDLVLRAELLRDSIKGSAAHARRLGFDIHHGRARQVWRVREQLFKQARSFVYDAPKIGATRDRATEHRQSASAAEHESIHKALLMGFNDRVCLKRDDDTRNYLVNTGQPAVLAYESTAEPQSLLLAPVIAGDANIRDSEGRYQRRALIRQACVIQKQWLDELFPERCRREVEINFDAARERVVAYERQWFDKLCLDEQICAIDSHADSHQIARLLAKQAGQNLAHAFALSSQDIQFLYRIDCLRQWLPALDMPDLPALNGSEQTEQAHNMLVQICWGKRSFSELQKLPFVKTIKGYLTYEQLNIVDTLAPARYTVPSGSQIKIQYEPGKPPVLSARIQELFGLVTTPTIAKGTVPLLIHLLAPNYRPTQVTQDLESFWRNTYPEVRKELRARYPKHPWPEDPFQAQAVRK